MFQLDKEQGQIQQLRSNNQQGMDRNNPKGRLLKGLDSLRKRHNKSQLSKFQ